MVLGMYVTGTVFKDSKRQHGGIQHLTLATGTRYKRYEVINIVICTTCHQTACTLDL